MAEEEGGFISRWSRRKRLQETEPVEAAPEAPSEEALAEAREAEQSLEDANRLEAEAIDLEALKYGDDFSAFLKKGVPDLLRRKALRKFFNSDPLLANLDGLNDYDIDYNNPAHMVYKSSWDVGRGFLTEAEALGQKTADLRSALADTEGDTPSEDTPVPEVADRATDSEPQTPEAPAGAGPMVEEPPDDEAPAPPRRVSLRRRLEG